MNAFCVLLGMAIIYFGVVILILKQNKNTGILTILPPEGELSEETKENTICESDIPQHTYSDNIYLNAIAKLLLERPDEPLKIAHFLDSLTVQADRDFLLNHLKIHNRKLHDTVAGLSAIDTSNIEGFRSHEIEVDVPYQFQEDVMSLTPEEELLMGGLPADLLYEEMEKKGFKDFSEFIDEITKTYIAKILSQSELEEIEKSGTQILSITSPVTSSLSSKAIQTSFEQGEIIATQIQKECEKQNNI